MKPYLKCVLEHGRECPNYSKSSYYQVYEEQFEIFSRTCDKGDDLRKSLLNNAKCLNEHKHHTEKKCGELLVFQEKKMTKEDCAEQKRRFECTFEDIGKHCGKAASEFMREITAPVTKFLNKNCDNLQTVNIDMLRSMSLGLY
ncbi:hypothetical protein X975_09224, partial [Stegodyphus mimosarum]